jgi:hypothetical protein
VRRMPGFLYQLFTIEDLYQRVSTMSHIHGSDE